MLRRLLIWVLIALCAVIAACGEDEAEQPATTSSTEASTTGAEPAGDDDAEARQDEDEMLGDGASGDDRPESGAAAEPRPTSVEDVITAVFTGSGDPSLICDELVTDRFVRVAYGARQGCIAAQQPGALADSVRIDVARKTECATTAEPACVTKAIAVPGGGPYDGVEVEVELVLDEGGAFQLDSLLADVPAGP